MAKALSQHTNNINLLHGLPHLAQDADNTRILFRAVPDRRADRRQFNSQLFFATGKK